MFTWLASNWLTLLTAASFVISGASVAVHMIAPLTESKFDDKLDGALSKLRGLLEKLALNKKV